MTRTCQFYFNPPDQAPEEKDGDQFIVLIDGPDGSRMMEFAEYSHTIGSGEDSYEYEGFNPWVFSNGSLAPGESLAGWAKKFVPQGEIK